MTLPELVALRAKVRAARDIWLRAIYMEDKSAREAAQSEYFSLEKRAEEETDKFLASIPMPTSPMGLTKRQRELLDFLSSYIDTHGISPSYSEMCAALGSRSKGDINRLVTELRARGHIASLPNHARSISIIERRAA